MKKNYFIILFCVFTLSSSLKAQTPLTQAVDFLAKDIYGVQHQLFDILDNQQKYVFIDFFSPTCGPCQNMTPFLDSVYYKFGENEADLYILAIDQNFNNEMVMDFEETYNIHYPAISGIEGSGSAVFEAYEIPYYPSLILIAPNHEIIEQAIPVPYSTQELIDVLESHGIQQVTAVEEQEKITHLNFYPNPAQDFIQINSNDYIQKISIFELTGQLILEKELLHNPLHERLEIAHFKSGIYLLSVEFKDGNRISKTFAKR